MRKILSFARRIGKKLRPNQSELLSTFLHNVRIAFAHDDKSGTYFRDIFSNNAFTDYFLEIGFGSGEHLFELAKLNKNHCYIGCEPYLNGVATLLSKIQQSNLKNIYIWNDDVNQIIDHLPDNTLTGVYILFPDPWPKKRHHKRRIINSIFIEKLSLKMKDNGDLYVATDHQEYAKWILTHLISSPKFVHTAKEIYDWTTFPSDWIKTKYQLKAESENKINFYFHFKKCDNNI